MHEVRISQQEHEVVQHESFDKQISHWQEKLDIKHYTIITFSVPWEMITEVDFEMGGEFVGITPNHDEKFVSLFHTRPLEQDDIVHELLHIRHPEWNEDEVNLKTGELLEPTE